MPIKSSISMETEKLPTLSVHGASGFIGSNYVKRSRFRNISIPRDIRDSQTPDLLYFISTTDNYNVFDNPKHDIETNLLLLIDTLESARKKFVKFTFNYISTWFVYGDLDIPFKETDICKPRGFYSITKHTAELLIQSYCNTFDLDFRIIRLANVVGAGDMKVSQKRNALQYMLGQVRRNEKVSLYENGEIIRDFLHIDDIVNGIDIVLERGNKNEIFNLGSGSGYKMKDLILNFKQSIGSSSEIVSIATPKFHSVVQARNAVLDITKVKSLGFVPSKKLTMEILESL